MNSLAEECNDLKRKYDVCFNHWFSDKFLHGKNDLDETCGDAFRSYQQCLSKAIREKDIDIGELRKTILGSDEDRFLKSPPDSAAPPDPASSSSSSAA